MDTMDSMFVDAVKLQWLEHHCNRYNRDISLTCWGWSEGAMVLGILITVGQGPIALAVGAGGGGLDIFTLIYPFFSFSLSLGDGSI